MQITLASTQSESADTYVTLLGSDRFKDQAGDLPAAIHPEHIEAAKIARFAGETGSIFETFATQNGAMRRIVLLGVGGGKEVDFEQAGGALVARLLTSGAQRAEVDFAALPPVDDKMIARFGLGAMLRSWRMDSYRTTLTEKQKPTLDQLILLSDSEGAKANWARQAALAQGVSLTRELVSEPANVLYPESFVERCQHLSELGIEITVLDEAQMAQLGMGALLGVAQGSVRKPRILAMKWDGTSGAQDKPAVFIGKGVTFDTGGISLKPGAGMEDMKWDMGGAGAVAGAMKALAGRKAKAHVVGICGLVENMPDGNAQRPGDVVTSLSGQTIEVINTDAEGRLVLCDVITWAQNVYNPEVVIDLATLTGAMIAALGDQYAGLFSNDEELAADLLKAGTDSGDPLWRWPMSDVYDKLIDSPIADMKNMGARFAGAITAAQFLKRFVREGVKWAHLDIAGMVWADKPSNLWEKGATGYGVRLIDTLVESRFES